MNERWTSPRAGPFPSGHLVKWFIDATETGTGTIATRCGHEWAASVPQIIAFTPEPPSTSEGRTCETCLRLANRDHRAGQGEDDGSTHAEVVP